MNESSLGPPEIGVWLVTESHCWIFVRQFGEMVEGKNSAESGGKYESPFAWRSVGDVVFPRVDLTAMEYEM